MPDATGTQKRDGRSTLADIFTAARHGGLTALEFRLWAVVRSYESPVCRASSATLAHDLDVSVSAVEKTRARLVRDGWIELEHRGPKAPVLRAVVPDALHESAEQAREALHGSAEQGEGKALHESAEQGASSAPSSAPECKQSTESTGTTSPSPPSDASPPKRDVRGEGESGDGAIPTPVPRDRLPRDARFPAGTSVAARAALAGLVRDEWWHASKPPVRGRGMRDELALLGRFVPPAANNRPPDLSRAEAFVRGVRRLADRGDRVSGCDPGDAFSGALVERILEDDPGFADEALSADDYVVDDPVRDAILADAMPGRRAS